MNIEHSHIKMKHGFIGFAVILLVLSVGVFINHQLESNQVITFDAEVKAYLDGNYKTEAEQTKAFEETIEKAFDTFVEKEVETEFRKEAKVYVSASRMNSLIKTEIRYEKIKLYDLEKVVRETIAKCQKIYPIENVKVVLLPSNAGLEGRTVGKNLIILYPQMMYDRESTEMEAENAIYHEYMHLISTDRRMKNSAEVNAKYTMLNFMIEEGRAVVFAKQQMNGYQSSLSKNLTADQLWSFYEEVLDARSFGASGGNGSIINGKEHSFLDYYYYGERLVELYISKGYEKQSAQWWMMEDAEIMAFIKDQSEKKALFFVN